MRDFGRRPKSRTKILAFSRHFCVTINHMTIYLHVCCGDCLLRYLVATGYPLPVSLQHLVKNYTDLPTNSSSLPRYELIYYNPNIHPKTEYEARLAVVRRFAHELDFPLHVLDYRPSQYFSLPTSQEYLRGLATSNRCLTCQNLRLHTTLTFVASQLTPDQAFSTTMLASRYLDHDQIRQIGHELAAVSGIPFINPSFLLSPDTLRTSGYYKQNYCGCLFSLTECYRRKFPTN